MLKRLSIGAAGGGVVTLSLGLAMMAMISTEFEAQEKLPALVMDINPEEVEPIEIRTIELQKLQLVEIPPAPPVIEDVDAQQPHEPIANTTIELPPIVKPIVDPNAFVISTVDTDAQPITRIEPNMPPRAERSGHCMMRFDVSAEGKPFNVMVTHCSEKLFERSSIRAVQSWTYRPKIQNGRAIARKNVRTKMGFNLLDERGNLIPE